jgi:hypothetical protein
VSQQPSGPGQPWSPAGQQPWDTPRQPEAQHQRPLPPPLQQSFAAQPPDTITRLGIWRLAIGIWLGSMLVIITMFLLLLLLGAALGDRFDSEFRTTTDRTSNFN